MPVEFGVFVVTREDDAYVIRLRDGANAFLIREYEHGVDLENAAHHIRHAIAEDRFQKEKK